MTRIIISPSSIDSIFYPNINRTFLRFYSKENVNIEISMDKKELEDVQNKIIEALKKYEHD